MSSHAYTVLPEQAQEDALHALRLLQVEERPFQRVSRSLLGKDTLLKWTPPRQLPSPPPDSNEAPLDSNTALEDEAHKRSVFRQEILLDFAALESSILRIQLINASNARERDRYAAEKAKILSAAQSVRDNTVALRAQLEEAQKMLQLRKGYDELAQKLIFEEKLKPRAETMDDIRGLEKEIEELDAEKGEFEGIWAGRKEAWERVVEVGGELVKVIKGVRDEPEADEKMEGADGDEENGEEEERSRLATPAAGGRTPAAGGRTPMVEGGMTPLPEDGRSPAHPINKFLDVDEAGTRSSSRIGSPMLPATQVEGDIEMAVEDEQLLQVVDGAEVDAKAEMDTEAAYSNELEQQQAETAGVEVMDES